MQNIILINPVTGNVNMAVEISSGNKFRNFDPIFEFSEKNPKNHDRPTFLRGNSIWQQKFLLATNFEISTQDSNFLKKSKQNMIDQFCCGETQYGNRNFSRQQILAIYCKKLNFGKTFSCPKFYIDHCYGDTLFSGYS